MTFLWYWTLVCIREQTDRYHSLLPIVLILPDHVTPMLDITYNHTHNGSSIYDATITQYNETNENYSVVLECVTDPYLLSMFGECDKDMTGNYTAYVGLHPLQSTTLCWSTCMSRSTCMARSTALSNRNTVSVFHDFDVRNPFFYLFLHFVYSATRWYGSLLCGKLLGP